MPKTLTTDLRRVDVRRLARDNLLVHGTAFRWTWNSGEVSSAMLKIDAGSVTFNYATGSGDSKRDVDQRVALTTTPCNYGKSRHWFVCPHCNQRAAILFLGPQVACRRCYNMAYPVQNESQHDRELRRLNAIRGCLGWEPGFPYWHGCMPKRMHWRTYWRLVVDHYKLALAVMKRMLERSVRSQERVARMLADHPEWDV
jgi:hypothetical protein